MTKRISIPLIGIFLTGIYLSMEIPFASHLLEILGTNSTKTEIDHIEHLGRIISGMAFALAIVGYILKKYDNSSISFTKLLVYSLFFSAFSMATVFYGEKNIVDTIAETSTRNERMQALNALLYRETYISKNKMNDPMSLTHKSIISFTSLSWLERLTTTQRREISPSSDFAQKNFKSFAEFKATDWSTAIGKMSNYFTKYREVQEQYKKSSKQLGAQAENYWNTYIQQMRKKGYVYGTTRIYAPDFYPIKNYIISKGVALPKDWNPWDKDTFISAFETSRRDMIEKERTKLLRLNNLPTDFPINITTLNEFIDQKPIQEKLVAVLDIPFPQIKLDLKINDDDLKNYVYTKLLTKFSADLDISRDSGKYLSNGEKLSQIGQSSVRSYVVPIFAITLSLAGMTFHVLKFTNYILLLTSRTNLPIAGRTLSYRFPRWSMSFAITLIFYVFLYNSEWKQNSNLNMLEHQPYWKKILIETINAVEPGTYEVGNAISKIGNYALLEKTYKNIRIATDDLR